MKKVLVIDDDPLAREIYKAILTPSGFQVDGAGDGETGLEKFKAGNYDCVVVDIYMPGISGLDLIEQMDPETSGVPILAISGADTRGGGSALNLARTLGAAKVLPKSFEHQELIEAVMELTGRTPSVDAGQS